MEEDQSECMIDKDVYEQFYLKQNNINVVRKKIDDAFFDVETQRVPEEKMGDYKEALENLKNKQRALIDEMFSVLMASGVKK